MFPDRVAEIRNSKEYQSRFDRADFIFRKIISRACMGEILPGNVSDYSDTENRLLTGQLAIVMNPLLMELSHCSHRAVSATLALHYHHKMKPNDMDKINEYLREQNKIAGVWYTRDSTSLILSGVNNWFQNGASEGTLNCKIMPGQPEDVGSNNLFHLSNSSKDEFIGDRACYKRVVPNSICNITHAEREVILTAKELLHEFNLPRSDRTILTCTWISCGDCLRLITENLDVFGNKIDVFSVYQADGDKDDEHMSAEIQDVLQKDSLGRLSGPFIALPKDPGYGWWPARKDAMTQLKAQLSNANAQHIKAHPREYRLLLAALHLLD